MWLYADERAGDDLSIQSIIDKLSKTIASYTATIFGIVGGASNTSTIRIIVGPTLPAASVGAV